jgi:hypothetical protein
MDEALGVYIDGPRVATAQEPCPIGVGSCVYLELTVLQKLEQELVVRLLSRGKLVIWVYHVAV